MRPMIRSLAQHVPAGRLGTESEVSAAIVFLLSEAAAFISGACLRIDGAAPNARRHWMMSGGHAAPEYQGFHRGVRPRVLGD
jgi:citronellol/citronellal dehydrogenase